MKDVVYVICEWMRRRRKPYEIIVINENDCVPSWREWVLARKWKSDMIFTGLLQDAFAFVLRIANMWTSWRFNVFDGLSHSRSISPPLERKKFNISNVVSQKKYNAKSISESCKRVVWPLSFPLLSHHAFSCHCKYIAKFRKLKLMDTKQTYSAWLFLFTANATTLSWFHSTSIDFFLSSFWGLFVLLTFSESVLIDAMRFVS